LAQLFLLRRAAQVLTLRGPVGARRGAAFSELGIIKDGSVLIRDGKIVSIGSARRIENLKEARGAIEISAEGAIVLPGFVDPGLQLNLNCTRSGSASPPKRRRMADFSDESLSLMRACLQHGTLNVQVKASAGGAGLRSDFAVLRHLAEIGNNPVGMVRSLRIAQPPLPQSAEAREFHELLSVLVNRKLVHAIEVAPECNETSGAPVWHAAAQRQIDVNLLCMPIRTPYGALPLCPIRNAMYSPHPGPSRFSRPVASCSTVPGMIPLEDWRIPERQLPSRAATTHVTLPASTCKWRSR
jgi:hypothetical protein